MTYSLRQDKFYEEKVKKPRTFFSAHPESLREISFKEKFINCIQSLKMNIVLFRRDTDNTDVTDVHRYYPYKSIQSMSSVFQCIYPFEFMYKNK